MSILYIASEKENISIDCHRVGTDGKSLNELLKELESYKTTTPSEIEVVITTLELELLGMGYGYFGGIELIKHIRLTPELDNINKAHIIALHHQNIDNYIKADLENIFLYSPALTLVKIPDALPHLYSLLSLDKPLHTFLFESERDEITNTHHFRNKLAIEQMLHQMNNPIPRLLEKPLWYKKLYYRNYGSKTFSDNQAVSYENEINVLLLDDLGKEWSEALLKVLPNAKINVFNNVKDSSEQLIGLDKKYEETRNQVKSCVKQLQANYSLKRELDEKHKLLKEAISNSEFQIKGAGNKLEKLRVGLTESRTKLHELTKSENAENLLSKLIDFKETETIESVDKKNINLISDLVNEFFKKITLTKETNSQQEKYIEKLSIDKRNIIDIAQKLTETDNHVKVALTNLDKLIKLVFEKAYDFVLLDMNFDTEKGVSSIKAGIKLLDIFDQLSFDIPIIIFTASTTQAATLSKYPTYIKGMTPLVSFVETIEEVVANSQIFSLLNLAKQLRQFELYFLRSYDYVDRRLYDTEVLSVDGVHKIKNHLKSIISSLENLLKESQSDENKIFSDIIVELGKIQELRIKSLDKDKTGESIWFNQNLSKNLIDNKEVELRKARNQASHGDTKATLHNINSIDAYMKKTFKRLLLG